MKYPLKPHKDWFTDKNYKQTGAELVRMSPKKFLKQVRPMIFDKRDDNSISKQLDAYDAGKKFEPLQLRSDGTEDGRHRAVAAMIKGVEEVPVLKWPDRQIPKEAAKKEGKGVMKTIKKVVKKYRDTEKYK